MFEQQIQTPPVRGDGHSDGHKKGHHNLLHEVQEHAKKLLQSKAGKVIKEGAIQEAKKIAKNETDGAKGGVDLVKTVAHAAKTGHVDKTEAKRALEDAGKVVSATPAGVHKQLIGDAARAGATLLPKKMQPTVEKVEKVMDLKKDIKSGHVDHILQSALKDSIYNSVHTTTVHAKS